MAFAMGFKDERDLVYETKRMRSDLRESRGLTPFGWARLILSCEIVFISDLAGSGYEWRTTTGWRDEMTVMKFRSIQRKMVWVLSPYFGGRLRGE